MPLTQTKKIKILSVFGTRPEAIKMAPLVIGLKGHEEIESILCVSGQHREMLDQVLQAFDLEPDFDLDIMQPGQSLSDITSRVLLGLKPVLEQVKPDWVFVHGDTATTVAASLAAYYERIPVAHIEAGLRTHNIYAPWPEEVNRRIASLIASCHFSPTEKAKANLMTEGVLENNILVTGNTVIDALLAAIKKLDTSKVLQTEIDNQLPIIDTSKKLILVTGHRRENFGQGLENICKALLHLSTRDDVQIIYPVHLNPKVKNLVTARLSSRENIHLIDPLSYLPFIRLMSKAYIIITDSGGIQEEAPTLGVPVLVTRGTTERPEALDAGTVKLVGTDTAEITRQSEHLLESKSAYAKMSKANNPYGDGKTVMRIISHILRREGV
ncbi:MAG: UDP-N-acetylglucosamine 2-epimerase (non-hydrolyzing) [Robiginitomaculum sp.]|nr:UDP-N-acetylglucosamine 2-epimerase (non-hydrolyzing) [Robiginitomaculum sp.]